MKRLISLHHLILTISLFVGQASATEVTPHMQGPDFNTLGNDNTQKPGRDFPLMPDDEVTPGSLCARANEYRYPEKIKYCNRNVDSREKANIIRNYDLKFGYRIESMNRADFKIDHLVPLCAGGSNENSNLWPQHKTVYEKTDRIEETICRLMSMGRLRQQEAVDIILDVKHNLEKSEAVLADLLRRCN